MWIILHLELSKNIWIEWTRLSIQWTRLFIDTFINGHVYSLNGHVCPFILRETPVDTTDYFFSGYMEQFAVNYYRCQ